MPCSAIEDSIHQSFQQLLPMAYQKLKIYEQDHPELIGKPYLYPPKLRELRKWVDQESRKQEEALHKFAQEIPNLPQDVVKFIENLQTKPDQLFAYIENMGIKLDCYSGPTKAKIVCDAAATLGSQALVGLGASAGSIYLLEIYELTKSEKVLKLISDAEKTEKRGSGLPSDVFTEKRRLFMLNYAEKEMVSHEEKVARKTLADKTTSNNKNSKVKFFSFENSKMKYLNDNLKQEDLVSALTHYRQELQLKKLKVLEKEFPNLKFNYFSDFKSVRIAFEGDMPKNLAQRLEEVTREAQTEFDLNVKVRHGVIRAGDNTEDWFRSSLAASDDEGTRAARYARTQQDPWKIVDVENDLKFKRWSKTQFDNANKYRKQLESQFSETDVMVKNADGKSVLSTPAVDIFRKNSDDLERARQLLKDEFGLAKLSPETVILMKKYVNSIDSFSPSLRVIDREIASLRNANHGGLSVDMKGLGAENINSTATAVTKAQNFKQAEDFAREAEVALTAQIDERRTKFKEIVKAQFKNDLDSLTANCSGDGCTAFLAHREMTLDEVTKINEALARSGESGRMRLSSQSTVKEMDARDPIKKRGEDFEKKLAGELSGVIEPRRLRGLMVGIHMGERPQLILSEANGLNLTVRERELIQAKFEKILKDAQVEKGQ